MWTKSSSISAGRLFAETLQPDRVSMMMLCMAMVMILHNHRTTQEPGTEEDEGTLEEGRRTRDVRYYDL